jgi:hypothetical protein
MISILTQVVTPRLEYAARQVFVHWMGLEITWFTNEAEFQSAKGVKINYTTLVVDAHVHIIPAGLLNETGISKSQPQVGMVGELPVLFPDSNTRGPGFDFFSAVFWMLSRMEEYEFTSNDAFGRFAAQQSLAYKNNFLELPVVDAWVKLLLELPAFRQENIQSTDIFKFICTIDVDNAYAIYGKPWWRQVLASGRDVLRGKPGFVFKRWKIWNGKLPDPNDTYSFLEKTSTEYKTPVLFFYLLGDYGSYDKNLTWDSAEMKKLVTKNASWTLPGIHPSFNSCNNAEMIKRETKRLRDISGMRVNSSRQHYLKCLFPYTFRHLIDAGIRNDYTLGFHDLPGYRAGTGHNFYFYDVLEENTTELLLRPFVLMDGTLHDYMKLDIEAAMKKTEEIFATAKKYGSPVCTLWHNDSIHDEGLWKGWQKIFLRQFELPRM